MIRINIDNKIIHSNFDNISCICKQEKGVVAINELWAKERLGWNSFFEKEYEKMNLDGTEVGRICSEHRGQYGIFTQQGELTGEISGKLRFKAEETGSYPAVGDWVVLNKLSGENKAVIHELLPRKSKFSRKTAGLTTKEQVVASNMDYVFLVAALNRDFNLRRLERYLIVAWESGAVPVVILSKADLCEDLEQMLIQVQAVAPGVPVHAVSALSHEGFDALGKYFEKNRSVVLMGSSGVGKSTIINELMGHNVMETQTVSDANHKGRHTTTHRQLILMENGGMIFDTPGMRELQLWDGQEGIAGTFEDIEELSKLCRFGDCSHGKEPGCAIKEALRNGSLDSDRYESFKKLQRELKFIENKQRQIEQLSAKKKGKSMSNGTRGAVKQEYLFD